MITKDFFTLLENNGGILEICGIKFAIGNNNDIDIYIEGKLYKWIRKADERELFTRDLTNAECGESADFIESFARDYFDNHEREMKSENETLKKEVNSLTQENETLTGRLEKAKEEFAKMKDDVTKFEFLQQFLTTRDLIIHK